MEQTNVIEGLWTEHKKIVQKMFEWSLETNCLTICIEKDIVWKY
jgi:hypothetical protein